MDNQPNVLDINDKVIKLNDVLRDVETGEMYLVKEAHNDERSNGLAATNEVNGRQDWLDVFPDDTFAVVGNMETVSYPNHEHSESYVNPDDLLLIFANLQEKNRYIRSVAADKNEFNLYLHNLCDTVDHYVKEAFDKGGKQK